MKKAWEKFIGLWGNENAGYFLRGSAGSLFLRICGVGLRFLSGVAMARLLGVDAYGHYAYAVTWLAVLAIPSMLGLDHVLIRFVPFYCEHKQWGHLRSLVRFSWKWGLGSSFLVGAGGIYFVLFNGALLPEARLTLVITLVAVPVFVFSQIQQSMLRGVHRPILAQFPEHVFYPGILLLLLGGFWTFENRMSAPWAAAINVFSWLTAVILGAYWVHRHLPTDVHGAHAVSEKKQWVSMIPGLFLFNFAYQFMSRTPTLALGIWGASRDVGIYSACTRGAEFSEFIYSAVTLAGAPLFARLYARGNRVELQRFVSMVARVIFGASFPVFVGLFLIVPKYLYLYGPDFLSGVWVMRVLLCAFFLNSLCGFVDVMLIVSGHQQLIAKVMVGLALANMGLCWLLIPRYGLMGAALASSLCVVSFKGLLVFWVYKKINIVSFPYLPRRLMGGEIPSEKTA